MHVYGQTIGNQFAAELAAQDEYEIVAVVFIKQMEAVRLLGIFLTACIENLLQPVLYPKLNHWFFLAMVCFVLKQYGFSGNNAVKKA